jgi:hypothetical protein
MLSIHWRQRPSDPLGVAHRHDRDPARPRRGRRPAARSQQTAQAADLGRCARREGLDDQADDFRSRPGALQPGTVERYARSILTELTLPKTEGDHRESVPCSAASPPAGRSSRLPSPCRPGGGRHRHLDSLGSSAGARCDGRSMGETVRGSLAEWAARQRGRGGCGERAGRAAEAARTGAEPAGALPPGRPAGRPRLGDGPRRGHLDPEHRGLCLPVPAAHPLDPGCRLARARRPGGVPGHRGGDGGAGGSVAAGDGGVGAPVAGPWSPGRARRRWCSRP